MFSLNITKLEFGQEILSNTFMNIILPVKILPEFIKKNYEFISFTALILNDGCQDIDAKNLRENFNNKNLNTNKIT